MISDAPNLIVWGIFVFIMMESEYMYRASELAARGLGKVNPNPLVGAVIVKSGRVIGEGWHEYYGGLHAERNALRLCTESARGAEMYVTLEPCCHYGKTPPCTEAIIEAGISKVIVGLTDPNPLVAGKGIERLRAAGIEVVTGVATKLLKEQNRIFLKYISTRKPWVVLKTAMTLDGKIATYTSDSKWITGEASRDFVQQMRSEYVGIVSGIGTVKADNPLLNCRLSGEVRQPIRIIVDSRAEISLTSQIVTSALMYRTMVIHTGMAPDAKLDALREKGVETVLCDSINGRVDIGNMLTMLGTAGIDSLLLECGGELNYSFIAGGHVDEVYAFIAPKLVGGRSAKTSIEGEGIERMNDAVELTDMKVEKIGEDFLMKARVKAKAMGTGSGQI